MVGLRSCLVNINKRRSSGLCSKVKEWDKFESLLDFSYLVPHAV
jgi:hypothetical protein